MFPGAPDRERGVGAAAGQAPQHHHADRGGGHVVRALPGHGAGQGERVSGGEMSLSVKGCKGNQLPVGAGRRSVRRHHLLGQIHGEGRLRHGVQPGRCSQVPAQHQHRPQGHKAGEPAGIYRHRASCFQAAAAAARPVLTLGCVPVQVCKHPDGTKSLKLGDFGLATVVEGPLYTVCGTPTYVAPEIIAESG